ncbi:hypothetical protein [Alicyclobacillus sp. SO9]|uniref:hypothetical protein n=1 Tax=Alicyclobacillus sp. SO9 TaxID=2665646 RepID=UPI0018E7FF96|nr:hypothetical protein [Alicyclobacillus sp. SO9]QQE77377.1 hypothetical protein GI364_15635 [Alicyclobacillus sp. SO9]
MRRTELEEYRQQMLQDDGAMDFWGVRSVALQECIRTIQTVSYEPKERPSVTGQLRRG